MMELSVVKREEIKRGSTTGFVLGLIGGILGMLASIFSFIYGWIMLYLNLRLSEVLNIFNKVSALINIGVGGLFIFLFIVMIFASNWMRKFERCKKGARIVLIIGILVLIYSIVSFILPFIFEVYLDSMIYWIPGILAVIGGVLGLIQGKKL